LTEIATFGETFAEPGVIEVRLHRSFAEAFDLHQESGYRAIVRLTNERAQEVVGWAPEFVAVCRTDNLRMPRTVTITSRIKEKRIVHRWEMPTNGSAHKKGWGTKAV